MSFASETVALLVLATHALGHQTSATQHMLLSAEERKSALRQLMMTVETAAKLAEVALAQEKRFCDDRERIKAETEGLGVEDDKATGEPERLAEVEMEKGRTKVETEGTGKEVGGTLQETEGVKAVMERFGNDVDRLMKEMKDLGVELEVIKTEKRDAEGGISSLKDRVNLLSREFGYTSC